MYYGKYRGVVKDTNDPEKRGRIRVTCPAILGKQLSNWALPCFPPSIFGVPVKDSLVWVEFEGGDKDTPIWSGMFYTTDTWQALFKTTYDPKKLVIRSYSNLDMRAGETLYMYANKDAYINNTNDTGTTIIGTITSLDQTVNGTVSAKGVTVNGTNVALKGDSISGTTSDGKSVSGSIT